MKPEYRPPQRILIVRVSALGDIVFCTSLLAGLRMSFPKAYIAWLADSVLAGVLEDDPRLNEVIRLSAGSMKGFSGLMATAQALRKESVFDWVIDAQGLLKSRLLARSVRARRYIGFESKEPGAFLFQRRFPKGGDPSLISSEYRYLASELCGPDPGPPRLLVSDKARERAEDILQKARLKPGFVALAPFTTRPQKHWVEANWGVLAHRLVAAGLGPCVVLGGPQDREAAGRIMAGMPAGSVDLVGATPLSDVPGVIASSRVLVGVDTGLTHIGIATGRPVVALFGSTLPYVGGANSPLKVLSLSLPCAPCKRRPTCNGAFTCMRDMHPDWVAEHTIELAASA